MAAAMAEAGTTAVVMHDPTDPAIVTGIVTARDIVTKILAADTGAHADAAAAAGEEAAFMRAMTFDPIMAVERTASLTTVLDEMQRRKFR